MYPVFALIPGANAGSYHDETSSLKAVFVCMFICTSHEYQLASRACASASCTCMCCADVVRACTVPMLCVHVRVCMRVHMRGGE